MFRRVKSPRKNSWDFPMKSSNQVSPRRRPSKGKGLRLRASESWMDENWIIHLWMRTGSQMTCRKPSKYGHPWKFMKIRIWSHDRYERQVNTIHRRTRPTHSCGFVCLRIENRKPPAADLNTWQDIGIWFWYANFLLGKEWLDLLYSKKCTKSLLTALRERQGTENVRPAPIKLPGQRIDVQLWLRDKMVQRSSPRARISSLEQGLNLFYMV